MSATNQSQNILVKAAMFLIKALAALLAPLLFYLHGTSLSDERLHSISSVLIGTSGTILGFMIAAISIIAALMDRTLIKNLKKTGHFGILMNGAIATCALLLLTIINGIANLFLQCLQLELGMLAVLFLGGLSFTYLLESGIRFKNIITSL